MSKRYPPRARPPPKYRYPPICRVHIIRLMKREGAKLVTEDARRLLIDTLVEVGQKVTKKAVALVKNEKRKRVTQQDIQWIITKIKP